MARPLRIEFENAFYHVLNRGLEKREIFKDEKDYEAFLKILETLHQRFHFKIHAFCLMPNHYHFYLQTPQPNLSKIMRGLNGVYTQNFNRRYKRAGPLFQGRYKAILVDKDSYSLELSRYIHLNPVKSRLSKDPEDYRWSSYKHYLKKEKGFSFMDTRFILSQFANKAAYMDFTREGLDKIWEPAKISKAGCLLGSADFIEEIKEKYLSNKTDSNISHLRDVQKPASTNSLKSIIHQLTKNPALQRKLLVYALKTHTPLSLKEIAKELGGRLSESAICQIKRRFVEEDARQGYIHIQQLNKMLNVKT